MPLEDSLLTTKLHLPCASQRLVSRPRLMARLNEAMECRLILLCAPAGYGKTTLLCQWLASSASMPVAWVSLDEGDNDCVHFWSYVCTALNQLNDGASERALSLLRGSEFPPLESFLITFINTLTPISKPFALVLDDFHLITNPAIHQALLFLFDRMPSQMHLILASRTNPPLRLSRLRARGQVVEVTATNLCFTLQEATTFLQEVMELDLSTEDIATLEGRTEGWITGLQLAALSLKERNPASRAQFLSAFAGSQRHLADYLADEVLLQQPEHIQTFLLQTSPLERLNGSLCDVVTGATNSQMLLEQVAQSNVFLFPLDEDQQWYRYHHLFAQFLQSQLQAQQGQNRLEETSLALHRRASLWYEHHSLMREAIDYALRGEDFERVASLIEQVAMPTFARAELLTLLRWFSALPEPTIRCHPRLCLYWALVLLFTSQYDAAHSRLQVAERSVAEQTEQIRSEDRHLLQSELVAVRARADYLCEDICGVPQLCQHALKLLPKDHMLRGLVLLTLGSTSWLDGNVTSASGALVEARELCQATHNSYVMSIATCYLAQVRLLEGCLQEAIQLYREALEHAFEEGLTGDGLYVGMGALLYEQNLLEEAMYHLRQGLDLAQKEGNVLVLIGGKLTLARVLQAQGNADEARQLMQQAVQLAQQHPITRTWVTALVRAYQVRLWLVQGNLPAAMQWVQESKLRVASDATAPPRPTYIREVEEITLARIYLAQGRYDEALEVLERLHQEAQAAKRRGRVLEILVLKALVYRTQGSDAQALSTLQQALKLAEPEGYVRLFVDEGISMTALLCQLRDMDSETVAYIDTLLAAFQRHNENTSSTCAQDQQQKKLQTVLGTLSEREFEILQCAAEGMSNQDIAQRLIIAESTVKWHLRNIYGKLHVHNRTQAILKARTLTE